MWGGKGGQEIRVEQVAQTRGQSKREPLSCRVEAAGRPLSHTLGQQPKGTATWSQRPRPLLCGALASVVTPRALLAPSPLRWGRAVRDHFEVYPLAFWLVLILHPSLPRVLVGTNLEDFQHAEEHVYFGACLDRFAFEIDTAGSMGFVRKSGGCEVLAQSCWVSPVAAWAVAGRGQQGM